MRWFIAVVFTLLGIAPLVSSYGQPSSPKDPDAEPERARKWALLIGINDYAEINDLKYCGRDIQVLRDRLLAAGFREENVVLLHDRARRSIHQPFKASIEHHLDEMLKSAGPKDLVIFAFSGHGVDLDGTSYLCPIEAQLKAPEKTMVSLEHIYRRLASSRAAQKLLLIDSCRNDPRPGGERSLKKPTETLTQFARSLEQPPKGIIVLSSCKPGEVSVEDDKIGHGVFMHFVAEGLQGEADRQGGNADERVSLFELYRYASLKTRTYVARTRDQMQTPVLRGEVTGDYELARVSTRALEVEAAWSEVRSKPDLYVKTSPVLQWYLRMRKRMITRSSAQSRKSLRERNADLAKQMEQMYQRQLEMVERQVRRPEAIVLSNPSIIVADSPEALLAIHRAYAFGIRGDWDGAIAASSEAIRLEPDNPFAYLLRGMAYAGRSENLHRAKSLLGIADARTIVRMLEMAEGNPMVARQVGVVLSELAKVNPEIVRDLETAKQNPATLQRAVQAALARLDSMAPLEKALENFQKIGIGMVVLLEKDAQLRSGDKVLGTVSGYLNYCEAKQVKGDWVWVEGVPGVKTPEAWVHKNQISQVFSYYELFQMMIR